MFWQEGHITFLTLRGQKMIYISNLKKYTYNYLFLNELFPTFLHYVDISI